MTITKYSWVCPENTHLGSFGHMGPSGGLKRPNQTDNSRNQSCVWHIGADWKRPTGPEVMNHDNITQGRPDLTHLDSSGGLEASRGQTSHTIQNFNKLLFSQKKFKSSNVQKKIRFFSGVNATRRHAPLAPSSAGAKQA